MNVANVLTGCRIVLSFCLLLVEPLSSAFLVIYMICGVTDVLDGLIARRLKVTSKFGAKLDSIADFCFLVVVIVMVMPLIKISFKIVMWIVCIALIRLLSILIVMNKHHQFAILHTYANKCTGLLLFCLPLFLPFMDIKIMVVIICTVATISAIEELMIHLLSKELNADIRSAADLFGS